MRGSSPESYWRAVFHRYTRHSAGAAARHAEVREQLLRMVEEGELPE